MTLISDFLTRYTREFDFFNEASRICAEKCEQFLKASGIRAMVTYRAKKPEKLETKLIARDKYKNYVSDQEIYSDIHDLSGVRIALYFPKDKTIVGSIITEIFNLISPPKIFPDGSTPKYSKIFPGYSAHHFRVHLKAEYLPDSLKKYSNANIEIQVASVLMHSWAEVEHDMVYKANSGVLSEEEYAILDEINGLVLAGEISLERLQKAGETRVKIQEKSFSNHYDLASFLYECISKKFNLVPKEMSMGRIDRMFRFLEEAKMASPEKLIPFIEAIDQDIEKRPIADQIIDKILETNKDSYLKYQKVIEIEREQPFYSYCIPMAPGSFPATQQEIGGFVAKWIEFEELIREKVLPGPKYLGKINYHLFQALKESKILDPCDIEIVDTLRKERNNLIHGIERHYSTTIMECTKKLERIIEKIKGGKT